ncbi:MAG: TlpA disulfide reductase family protein [Bdellovibrionota bacterium]
MIKNLTAIFLLFLSFSSIAAKLKLKDGPWRFEMKATYAVIPFVIDFKYEGKSLTGTLRNGKENIPLNGITVKKNMITIPIQHYENELELELLTNDLLRGKFVRLNKNPRQETPVEGKRDVKARYGGKYEKPAAKFNGTWAVTLKEEDGKEAKGVVILEQKKSKLSGSILSPTGDYRYFEGYVSGEFFEAASFDGVYNYVFKGRIEKNKMEANILANWKTDVAGVKDDKASLPDPYKQTQLDKMSFSFPDINGKKVSLSDFKGKPVIVSFFGSWCPNCIDEMNYLVPWFKENKKRGIELIALSFERSLDQANARMQLTKTAKKLDMDFPVLLAGSTSEDKPMDKIPGLKNFISFPTTVYLNKKHEVVKIHAGFTGPSTGKFYEEWKKEFNHDVDELLK